MSTQRIAQLRLLQTDTDSQVILMLSPVQASYINKAVMAGLWGNTPARVSTALLNQKVLELIKDGIILQLTPQELLALNSKA